MTGPEDTGPVMAPWRLEDGAMGPQEASDRIWLKQSIQFSVGGQVRLIEMTLPLRPGASPDEIERLLRQADAGLDQMTAHLNKKVEQLLGEESRSPAQRVAPASTEAEGAPLPSAGGSSQGAGAYSPAEGVSRPALRSTDVPAAVSGASLDRKQFIGQIAVLGLNPRQAMERLGVRTLDGVNLRQALEQLRLQLLHERAAPAGGTASSDEPRGSAGTSPRLGGATHSGGLSARQPPDGKPGPQLSQPGSLGSGAAHTVLEGALSLDEAEEQADDAVGEEEEYERPLRPLPPPIPIRGERTLSAFQERGKALMLLERLRRLRGRLIPPSSDQIKVFRNVVEQQLGSEKTVALLHAVWRVSTSEQLSQDQIAECIHWGKADDFDEEVDMLLDLTAAEES